MSPIIGEQDDFEGIYTEAFRSLARPYGEFVKYERDRAAIDIGLHLTQRKDTGFRTIANSRIWFQLKGIRNTTLSLSEFNKVVDVSLDLDIEDLKFWYASPETVYLAVYIEAANTFLAEDIHDIVDRRWGESIFSSDTFRPEQKTARVRVLSTAKLDSQAWSKMYEHRSIRIDGPSFRGRPLGHRLDPLRSCLAKMESSVFAQVVDALLSAHDYEVKEKLDPAILFAGSTPSSEVITMSRGVLHNTYEWIWQRTTQHGFDEANRFQIEGNPFHAQGPCVVVVHSKRSSRPSAEAIRAFAHSLAHDNIKQLLVFVNDREDPRYFGAFFAAIRDTGVQCIPQHLEDLAFNLLTTTNVYLSFRDRINWDCVNYLFS